METTLHFQFEMTLDKLATAFIERLWQAKIMVWNITLLCAIVDLSDPPPQSV